MFMKWLTHIANILCEEHVYDVTDSYCKHIMRRTWAFIYKPVQRLMCGGNNISKVQVTDLGDGTSNMWCWYILSGDFDVHM